MGRHVLRKQPTPDAHATEARTCDGQHVMLGGIARPGERWAHWVPRGATTEPYRHGLVYHAACGELCVPARWSYLRTLQACPSCDRACPGFFHLAQPDCQVIP